MTRNEVLFETNGKALTPKTIRDEISRFPNSYIKATEKIIARSANLDEDGQAFVYCAGRILTSFRMTRSGPFKGLRLVRNRVIGGKTLSKIWTKTGAELIAIRNSVPSSGISRDRYLRDLDQDALDKLTEEIWQLFKRILPYTMGETSYGLVGASKILFSVLPEIVLPIDNAMWLTVFETVDIGDVIKGMASEIRAWETATGERLNEMDPSRPKRLTTLPSVYNVMAMAAKHTVKGKTRIGPPTT